MKEWHCVLFGQPQGPFTVERLEEMASMNEITGETLVWSSSPEIAALGWVPAAQTELAAIFAQPPAPAQDPEPLPPPEPTDVPEQTASPAYQLTPFEESLPPTEQNDAPEQTASQTYQLTPFEEPLPQTEPAEAPGQAASPAFQLAPFEESLPPTEQNDAPEQTASPAYQLTPFEESLPPTEPTDAPEQTASQAFQLTPFEESLPPTEQNDAPGQTASPAYQLTPFEEPLPQPEQTDAPEPSPDARELPLHEISPTAAEIMNIFQASGESAEPVRELLLAQLRKTEAQAEDEIAGEEEQTGQISAGGAPLAKQEDPGPEPAPLERRLAAFAINLVIPLALGLLLYSIPSFWAFKLRILAAAIVGVTSLMAIGYIGYSFHILEIDGQSVGKKIMRIRIADPTGDEVALWKIMTLRWSLCGLSLLLICMGIFAGYVSVLAGLLVFLADTCFIFGKSRRTLHDRIAGTIVTIVPAENAEI